MAEEPSPRPARHWTTLLPNEHGFWVMLAASLISALLRARLTPLTAFATTLAGLLAVAFAGATHRRIRRSERAQIAASVGLAASCIPVEVAGEVSPSNIASAFIARSIVFLCGALLVRAAFARSARGGAARSALLHIASFVIALLTAVLFLVSQRIVEAAACAMAASVCAIFLESQPTVKQLKPLGITLGGLVLMSSLALAL